MAKSPQTPQSHTFAWDRFSFDVPEDWNLSMYTFGKKVSDLCMEDDDTLRLEMEWTRRKHRINEDVVLKRFHKATKKMADAAEGHARIDGLPKGWTAFVYTMPNRKKLVIAYHMGPEQHFFGFFKIHFEKVGKKKPEAAVKLISKSFKLHEDGLVPWKFYDIDLELDRSYWLVGTQLQAGCKILNCQWRMRKLTIWQISLADVVLKGRTVAAFASEYLGKVPGLRGLEFRPHGLSDLAFKRRRMFLHYEEIGRMCFKYSAACALLPEKNAIVMVVYSYRYKSDLAKLAGALKYPGTTIVADLCAGRKAFVADEEN